MDLINRIQFDGEKFVQPYECALCGITFKRRRLNCPACGSINVRRRTER